MENLEYRMYGFVPYNISDIQKGIQYGHGVVEYSLINGNDDDYIKWSVKDKTSIILNGGTTNNNEDKLGSLNIKTNMLDAFGVKYATFEEPDLGDQLSAVVFLLDERVWDVKKYPSPPDVIVHGVKTQPNNCSYVENMGGPNIYELRKYIVKHKLA